MYSLMFIVFISYADAAELVSAIKKIKAIKIAERRKPIVELIEINPSTTSLRVNHVLIVSISRVFPNPLKGVWGNYGQLKCSGLSEHCKCGPSERSITPILFSQTGQVEMSAMCSIQACLVSGSSLESIRLFTGSLRCLGKSKPCDSQGSPNCETSFILFFICLKRLITSLDDDGPPSSMPSGTGPL